MFSLPQSCSPGPGAYSPKPKLFNNSPSISMMSRHEKIQSQTSEAKFVDPKSTLLDKKVSFGLRSDQKATNISPGPCEYSPTSPGTKGMGITLKSRTNSVISKQCDVPFYTLPCFADSTKQIYLKGRHVIPQPDKTPGPTEYTVPSQDFNGKRGISLAGRTTTCKADNMVPGPGQYDLKSTLNKTGGKILSQVKYRGGLCLDVLK
ncbi:hypothetical protein SS50377_23713 [Spironucleus salmonicida]|uniref:SHIPPO 1-like protein n=1 Tax=Spironucleus salmonicida TaxID=348837 RepID=V6LNZ2_9EUKA|nr:hypothetical protein SS50377_23713 [Spironucleus salmonicida]|eukprot:EST46392.1 hypothetical protein SS50377_13476 [Spironucleus salmonicida]